MEQWFKLLLNWAVPIFNTLVYVKNNYQLWSLPVEPDKKRGQTQAFLEHLETGCQLGQVQTVPEKLTSFGNQQAGEIQALIRNVGWANHSKSLDNQRWRFEQEKALQKQLADSHRETQLKLAAHQRETALQLPEVYKILDHWPLRLFPSQILESRKCSDLTPLRIFLASPTLRFEQFGSASQGVLDAESRLAQGLREFLSQNYPLHHPVRSTEFLGGAWESKRFHSESSIKALFGMLKSEPTLILESEVDGDSLNFRMAYWGLGQEKYCYATIFKLPYREFIFQSAKMRAWKWKQTRDKLLALGKTLDETNQLGGVNTVNLKILEEEEVLKNAGIDLNELSFHYQVNSKDFETLYQFLTTCHCLVAGWVADVHHLVYRDVSPRLPELLPGLLEEATNPKWVQAVMQAAVSSYRDIFGALEIERPCWIPELALKLAQSLARLPAQAWAKEQVDYSIASWLQQHQVLLPEGVSGLEAMESAVAITDQAYIQNLQACFAALEDEQGVAQSQGLLSKIANLKRQPELETSSISLAHTLTGFSGGAISVAISPAEQVIIADHQDNTIKLWHLEVENGQLSSQLAPPYILARHAGRILTIAVSPVSNSPLPDSGLILASSDITEQRSRIYLWDLHTRKLLRVLYGHRKCVYALAISPDGRLLASGSHKIKIWDLQTGEPLRTLYGHRKCVYALAISPDGRFLVSGSEDKTVKIWSLHTGEWLQTLTGHKDCVRSIAVSPNGQMLASGSEDKTIKIWHLGTGKLLYTLTGHSETIYSVSISPNGQFLASGSGDKTIKVWNLSNGKLLHTLAEHSEAVDSVAMSPVGDRLPQGIDQVLVSGSEDKTVKIWQL